MQAPSIVILVGPDWQSYVETALADVGHQVRCFDSALELLLAVFDGDVQLDVVVLGCNARWLPQQMTPQLAEELTRFPNRGATPFASLLETLGSRIQRARVVFCSTCANVDEGLLAELDVAPQHRVQLATDTERSVRVAVERAFATTAY